MQNGVGGDGRGHGVSKGAVSEVSFELRRTKSRQWKRTRAECDYSGGSGGGDCPAVWTRLTCSDVERSWSDRRVSSLGWGIARRS